MVIQINTQNKFTSNDGSREAQSCAGTGAVLIKNLRKQKFNLLNRFLT